MPSTLHETSQHELNVNGQNYIIYSLARASLQLGNLSSLPKSLKILLENLLRCQDDDTVTDEDIRLLAGWGASAHVNREIAYRPVRVLMQDFTGVPAVVDLAAMREAVNRLGGDVMRVNPECPVDLVIDHSVTVDYSGDNQAVERNVLLEMERNHERYGFLRWGQQAFSRFRVVPPGTGICHQVNLEYLGKAVCFGRADGKTYAYPDTLVGTDSHTTMINALGVLGWGVGGIEAEAAMLGQPISMLIPDVIGFKLSGKLQPGITATDLVLTVTEMLRNKGVVGKFVEFYGDGLDELPLADRATIANMAPECGATCNFFPIDDITLSYMRQTGRSEQQVALVDVYAKEQGLWRKPGDEPVFTSCLSLDMTTVEPCLAGPKRPQDRVALSRVPQAFADSCDLELNQSKSRAVAVSYYDKGQQYQLTTGAVVIAAITSCTNTSNPGVMMAAGLLAKKAIEKGLTRKNWVKASLAPGSKVVSDYLAAAQLTPFLDKLGFNLVGYGCTTCIGNSGPLADAVQQAIREGDLTVSAVLSGNRNFEGRIHPDVKTNWLASPPLVVAYALAGNINIDLQNEPLGYGNNGAPVWLRDIWPTQGEIEQAVQHLSTDMFHKEYATVFDGTEQWQQIEVNGSAIYNWDKQSTYIRQSPFFEKMNIDPEPIGDINGAHILLILGDSVTTDHISPAGTIKAQSPAGRYLLQNGVTSEEFNSYGSRRGNHEVMVRGTFANIRIKNEMLPGIEGGRTRCQFSGEVKDIYDAAMTCQQRSVPLVVIAGKEYGSGSSRDWAAKGPRLLGVSAIIAESFERIHRSNLIGMGILPLMFPQGVTRKTLSICGDEKVDVVNLSQLQAGGEVTVILTRKDGRQQKLKTRCCIDTQNELTYYLNGGILHYVVRKILR